MTLKSTANAVDVHVGSRVWTKRECLGKGSADVARYLGCSEAAYLAREQGQIHLSAQELFQLARFFEVPIAYYYEGLEGSSCKNTGK